MTDREAWTAPLEEIWEMRRRLLAEFDNDLARYVAHLIELQDQEPYRDRLISKSGRRPGKGKSAA